MVREAAWARARARQQKEIEMIIYDAHFSMLFMSELLNVFFCVCRFLHFFVWLDGAHERGKRKKRIINLLQSETAKDGE